MTGNRFSLFRRDFNQTLKTETTTKNKSKQKANKTQANLSQACTISYRLQSYEHPSRNILVHALGVLFEKIMAATDSQASKNPKWKGVLLIWREGDSESNSLTKSHDWPIPTLFSETPCFGFGLILTHSNALCPNKQGTK